MGNGAAAPILVLGYGNELRGDDAAGPRVAALLSTKDLPGVRVLVLQQLTPELAEPLAQARAAIFVDAALADDRQEVAVQVLTPSSASHCLGHAVDPSVLLALARDVFGRCPAAWLMTVPALAFDLGAPLSPPTRRGVQIATSQIERLIRDLARKT